MVTIRDLAESIFIGIDILTLRGRPAVAQPSAFGSFRRKAMQEGDILATL